MMEQWKATNEKTVPINFKTNPNCLRVYTFQCFILMTLGTLNAGWLCTLGLKYDLYWTDVIDQIDEDHS